MDHSSSHRFPLLEAARAASLLLLLIAIQGGCAHTPEPLPAWAIHAPPPRLDAPISGAEMERRLLAELSAPALPEDHLSPERITSFAIEKLKAGKSLDAALLLSIASHRYHEEGVFALDKALREEELHMRGRPPQARTAYGELINAELRIYLNSDYHAEINAAMSLWEHRSHAVQRLSDRLAQLSAVRGGEPSAEMSDIAARIEAARTPTEAETPLPALAEVYRRHLVAQLQDENYASSAAQWLSATPFPVFLREGLARATTAFDAPLCRNLASRMAAFRGDVIYSLDAPRPETRGNAVMALALYGDEADAALLEERAAAEQSPAVKLVHTYAQQRSGKGEHLQELISAASTCGEAGICDLAIQLLEWLPQKDVVRIDDSLLARILVDRARTHHSRFFAAVLLGEIGAAKALSDPAIGALLRTSEDENDELAEWSTAAVVRDIGLDGTGVRRWLRESGFGRHALYLRLASIATAEDLPHIREVFLGSRRSNDRVKSAITAALGKVPGKEAEALLTSAFRERADIRLAAAIALANRDGIDPALLRQLADERRGSASALLAFAAKSPTAEAQMNAILVGSDIPERARATQLAAALGTDSLADGLAVAARTVDARYYPNDVSVRFEAWRALVGLALAKGFLKAAVAAPTSDLERKRDAPR